MFQITQRVLKKTEAFLLDLPTENKLWGLTTRYIIFPYKYLLLGLKDFFKPASFWMMILFFIIFVGGIIVKQLDFQIEQRQLIINIIIFVSLILVIFSVPSTYAYSGVEPTYVEKVSEYINNENLDTIEKISLLEKNIEIIESRISSRVSFYKWLVGASWAIYMLFFNLEMRYLISNKVKEPNNELLSTNIFSFLLALFSAITILLLIIGYKRASDILIKSIEFGCVECKYVINKKE